MLLSSSKFSQRSYEFARRERISAFKLQLTTKTKAYKRAKIKTSRLDRAKQQEGSGKRVENELVKIKRVKVFCGYRK